MPAPSGPAVPAVLVLGGTSEGRVLATALEKRFGARLRCVTSFATPPAEGLVPGVVRAGPFSGVAGLTAYLQHERMAAVLVATHPFAVTIARNTRLACEACQIPRLTLTRPFWMRAVADRWTEVNSMAEAAWRLPSLGRRAFLAIGVRQLPVFADRPDMWFLVRLRQAVPLPFPLHDPPHGLVIGAGTEADDLALMR
ncbi:MAG: Cobalt-precorrin-6x reductase, partial [Rhodospirillaceae bacterium]